MLLVDTSVWIDHFRKKNAALVAALERNVVVSHPHVIGELALGSIKDRKAVLGWFHDLTPVTLATEEDVHTMIEERHLFAKGIGYSDAHLLASALIEGDVKIWSKDKKLNVVATELGVATK